MNDAIMKFNLNLLTANLKYTIIETVLNDMVEYMGSRKKLFNFIEGFIKTMLTDRQIYNFMTFDDNGQLTEEFKDLAKKFDEHISDYLTDNHI